MMASNMLVTVFIPVYNGEKFLFETLSSVQNQTYKNIEVLLVDDGSTDGSKKILDEFAVNDARFKVLVKANVGMVSASWNFIMPKITGEYVFYSSQDDIFSKNLIEEMVKKQQLTHADSILPDMEYYFENKSNNQRSIGLHGNREVVLTGRQACQESLDWIIHGFPLTKTSLLREEVFFEDAFDTDELITRKLFFKSNKVVFSHGIFFYRQDNPNAITKTFSAKNYYTLLTLFRLYKWLQENHFEKAVVFGAQKKILNRYFDLLKKFNSNIFISKSEEKEIASFLTVFSKRHICYSFCLNNFGYALRHFHFKYIFKLVFLKLFFAKC